MVIIMKMIMIMIMMIIIIMINHNNDNNNNNSSNNNNNNNIAPQLGEGPQGRSVPCWVAYLDLRRAKPQARSRPRCIASIAK